MMSKKVNFGVGIPTGTEGLMYPIPFAQARDSIRISVRAEELKYDSVWGNDHVSTQNYVGDEFDRPPNYYAPLLVLAAIAENTTKLKVATALLVVPFRHPVVIAKELATLDQLTNGRLITGVGIGAYREELLAMLGERAKSIHRGRLLDEALTVLIRIFDEDKVTHKGEYFDIQGHQSYPKPLQKPFPFYLGGNSPEGWRRTAEYGMGWLPAVLTPEEIASAVDGIKAHCETFNRDYTEIDIAPQLIISIGKNHDDAMEKFQNSQLFNHMESLKKSTLKDQDTTLVTERNLVGGPDELSEQLQTYIDAGVTTFSALLFAVNTVEEMLESMQFFSEEVMKNFM
jgi:probable F420-dependent oxidoreductase